LATFGFDCFEVYFHPNQFPFSAENLGVISRFHEVADKVVVMPVASPIVNTTVWHKLTVEFVAQGDECFFSIGCFKKILAQNVGALDSTQPNVNVQFGVSYFYDDFVLTEIPDDTTPEPSSEPVVPNVFTPNADGINDFWVIENLPRGSSVAIYNRWGQRVYFAENYANDWGGEGLPSGTYFAELVFRDLPPRRLAIYLKRE
jgi:gliding motility-associated-like protein